MSSKKVKVSIFCSIFKSGKYIEHYLEDITRQTIFDECELIIVAPNPTDFELEKVNQYKQKYTNIQLIKLASDPGLYACWNLAIKQARGEYLNNANLDDSKKINSIEVHRDYLDSNPDIDLVYSDSFISLTPNSSFEQCKEQSEYRYDFPDFSIANLIDCNPPHQSPMYRKNLHKKFGFFDESYKSASDAEFWLRCATGGSKMKKINEVLGVYYFNPSGVSSDSSNETWKIKEEKRMRDKYKSYGQTHNGNTRRIVRNMHSLLKL